MKTRQKSGAQPFITDFIQKGQTTKNTDEIHLQKNKNDQNHILIDSSDSENIDILFERHQIDEAQDDSSQPEMTNELDDSNDADKEIEEVNRDEEIEEALKDPNARKAFVNKHYEFSKYQSNYSYYKCKETKFEDGRVYQCKYENRLNRLDFYHEHDWTEVDANDINITKDQKKSVSDYDIMLTKIMLLAGHHNLSFPVIESSFFWDLLEFVFKLGQKKYDSDPKLIIKKPSHSTIRNCFIQTAKKYHNSQIQAFSHINYLSLTLDAGSLQYGHFLDYAISSTQYNIKPYLYQADFAALNTSEYIREQTEKILIELFDQKIRIRTITGDNYPAQLYALSNWSRSSLWKRTTNLDVRKVLYFSCICHFMQLLADDIENVPIIQKSKDCLNNMKQFINKKFSKIVGKVPDEVETRWFSHYNSLKFILTNKIAITSSRDAAVHQLKGIRGEHVQMQREELLSILKDDNFDLLNKYANVMLPIYITTLFFEENTSQAVSAVPIIKQVENYWEKLLNNQDFGDFHSAITILLQRINHRKFHLLDWPLLNLAYSLTPGGRIYARKILIENGYEIEEEKYDSMVGLDPCLQFELRNLKYKIKLNQINNEKSDPIATQFDHMERNSETFIVEEEEQHINSEVQPILIQHAQNNLVFMIGNVKPYFEFNAERSIDGLTLFPFERKMDDLEFRYQPCHFNLLKKTLEDLCERFGYTTEKESIVECYDFWLKAKTTDLGIIHYQKNSDVKIWKDMAIHSPCWKFLSDIALTLISAQGSETICERKISMQRATITNRRLSSKEDLVEARFRLACNKPPDCGKVVSLNDLANKKMQQQKIKIKELAQSLISKYKS